ncbi:MAG: site-2 protease family protein [Ruminococcaceae bacterium]|nr:site-2 protease family protein [Oscillospiraceae bacterium]
MAEVFRNLDWSVLTDALLSIIPALLCITFHEVCHGYTAYLLGDNTAKNRGRLTLNPIKHLDIMGLVMMAIFHFGWAKPVPVDMRNFKKPKRGMAITALAGPLSNVLLTVVFLVIYGLLFEVLYPSTVGHYVLQMIYLTSYISLAFAIFNIIPIPPMDGSKVLFSFFSDSAYMKLMRYERYGMIILVVLIATDVLAAPLDVVLSFLYDKLFVIAEFAHDLVI